MKIKKIVNLIFKLSVYPIFLYPLYGISKIFPRTNKIWVFGSYNNTFADNSKYFYLYVVDKQASNTKYIWITGSQQIIKKLQKLGYEAYYRWSLKGLWYSLRAKKYIYSAYSSDINYWTSGSAIKFNMWHGIPLKKVEYDIKVGKLGRKYNSFWKFIFYFFSPWNFQKPDYLLSTSSKVSEILAKAFKISPEKCVEFGYPRCEHFLWKKNQLLSFIQKKEPELNKLLKLFLNYNKIIIYMPTFRENADNDLKNFLDFKSLNNFLQRKNYLLIIKPHSNLKTKDYKTYENIRILPSSIDLYMILPFTDILITDYSSVMFDYILLKKPVILYQPDREHYEKNERGLYFSVEELKKDGFLIAKNSKELLEILTKIESFKISYNVEKWWNLENLKKCNKLIYNFIKSL